MSLYKKNSNRNINRFQFSSKSTHTRSEQICTRARHARQNLSENGAKSQNHIPVGPISISVFVKGHIHTGSPIRTWDSVRARGPIEVARARARARDAGTYARAAITRLGANTGPESTMTTMNLKRGGKMARRSRTDRSSEPPDAAAPTVTSIT